MVGDGHQARFMLDTGSSHSVVSSEFAAAIGATPVAKTTVMSAIGATDLRLVVRIDGLMLGAACVDNVMPSVVSNDALGSGIDGLLGQDVLASRTYTIDYRRRVVTWGESNGAASAAGVSLALHADGGRYVVDLPQRQTVLHMVPDSGAEALVLFQPVSLGLPLRREGITGVSTLAAIVDARQATLFELRVGTFAVTDIPAVLLGRRGDASMTDGLLPLALFGRATFDAPGGRLIVEAR
jgi:hypothetical protein